MPPHNELGQPIGESLPDRWQPPPAPPQTTLEGNHARIEPLNPDKHLQDLFDANCLDQSGAGWTYLAYGPFENINDYQVWMQAVCQSKDPMFWAYIDKMTNRAVGLGSYLRINPKDAVIEVGHIRYSPKLQRTALATEVMYLKMKYVFELGYRRYEWKCDALNEPSRRAAERYGFVFEGVFRQATHYRGRNRDTAWFSITDQEWSAISRAHEAWLSQANFDAEGQQRQPLADFMKQFRNQA